MYKVLLGHGFICGEGESIKDFYCEIDTKTEPHILNVTMSPLQNNVSS